MYHKSQKILYQPPHPSPTTHIITPPTSHKAPLSSSVLLRQQDCLCEALKNLFCTFTHWLYGPAFGELFSSVCVCVCLVCNVPHSSYAEQRKGQWPHFTRGARGGWWRAKWLMAEGEKAKRVDVPREHPVSRSRYLQCCHVSILVTTYK